MAVTPDSSYYLRDGNAVFQVQSTLFKVHRSILTRDESTFEDVFSPELEDPSDSEGSDSDGPINGSCNQYPIHLREDKVDEFRALLWSCYALPSDIVNATRAEVIDTVKFTNLARITYKYNFTSTEIWALDTLSSYLSCVPLPIPSNKPKLSAVKPLSADILENLTTVAVLCAEEDHPLFDEVMAKWELLLDHGVFVGTAIRVAESLKLQDLRASAYYRMMLKGRKAWDLEPNVSREQKFTLLSGHYSLFKFCQDVLKSPLDVHSCASATCRHHWTSFWKDLMEGDSAIPVIDSLDPLDILQKLVLAQDSIKGRIREVDEVYLLTAKMRAHCRNEGARTIEEFAQKVKSRLPNYFADVA